MCGTIKGVTVKLSAKDGSSPVFYKLRTIPNPLHDGVGTEIRKRVIEKVLYSVWVLPFKRFKSQIKL